MKKTVLITGANKSIGFEAAKQLLEKGYFVYIGSRNLTRGNEAVEKLKAAGYNDVALLQLEVTDSASIAQAKQQLESKIPHLDVLINNAGIPGSFPQDASTTDQSTLRQVFDTNFFGVIEVTQAFLPLLKKSAAPRIVNVSSDLGSLGNQTNSDYEHYAVKPIAYCSSKTALNAYTVMLAYELRNTNFKVNSVNPGYTATDFNNHSGPKSVEDGAKVVVDYAIIGDDGPTGKFFSDYGETPW